MNDQANRDLAVVLHMVSETIEDRAKDEVDALVRLARRLDDDRNRMAQGNRRLDWSGVPLVPCHFTTSGPHPASKREAESLGLRQACKCDGTGKVVPFLPSASEEALVDDYGWSRAEHAVRHW